MVVMLGFMMVSNNVETREKEGYDMEKRQLQVGIYRYGGAVEKRGMLFWSI